MTKSDFIDWKASPVTKQVFAQVQERISDLKSRLVGETLDPTDANPAATAGAIRALEFVLDVQFEEGSPD